MFLWYKNKKVGIYFDKTPYISVRYSMPSMSLEGKKSIEKYPFINKREVKILLKDYKKEKQYTFTVPKGYCFDGASIPRIFWRVIGTNTDNKFLISALVHDVLCENHKYVGNDRAFSTNVFDALLESSGVGGIKRFCMKNSVACFQTMFCKW